MPFYVANGLRVPRRSTKIATAPSAATAAASPHGKLSGGASLARRRSRAAPEPRARSRSAAVDRRDRALARPHLQLPPRTTRLRPLMSDARRERRQVDAARGPSRRVQRVDERGLARAVVERVGPAAVGAHRAAHRQPVHRLVALARVDDLARVELARAQVQAADRVGQRIAGRRVLDEVQRAAVRRDRVDAEVPAQRDRRAHAQRARRAPPAACAAAGTTTRGRTSTSVRPSADRPVVVPSCATAGIGEGARQRRGGLEQPAVAVDRCHDRAAPGLDREEALARARDRDAGEGGVEVADREAVGMGDGGGRAVSATAASRWRRIPPVRARPARRFRSAIQQLDVLDPAGARAGAGACSARA